MKKISLTIIFICFIINAFSSNIHYTIIVSLDGFRWDYPTLYHTPNIDRMSQMGVSATMIPSYPSSTFPNHYTLVTGLVPDHHGIINNTFWDVERGRQYSIGDSLTRNDVSYYKGETIWATAQRQGVSTASLYWIGSDMPINNNLPDKYKKWSDEPRLTFEQRIDTALQWLNNADIEQIPRLITLYLEEPDGTGHRFGPHSDETALQVQKMDSLIGVLLDGIQQLPIASKVNFILTSDHGMTSFSPDRFINAKDHLNSDLYTRIVGSNPSFIFCDSINTDGIYNQLSKIPHLSVYKKKDIPSEFNYGTNPNIGDILVVADLGWQFGLRPNNLLGGHGYPVKNKDMHVFFRATGPDFKQQYSISSFDNTAIYSMLCYLLRISPSQNDGRLDNIQDMFQ